ncbi:MAG TPA: NBR1-Ig-like domain-containing protein [Bellilinea sp.]|nr:NBR1-Ig-like domain-containing protein [Bellilinea sp.]
MRISRIFTIATFLILIVILTACNALGPQVPPTIDPAVVQATVDAASTQVVLTIAAQLTGTALAQPTNTPTNTLVPTQANSPTQLATNTPLATATNTRVPVTLAPTFTATPANYTCSLVSSSPAAGQKFNINDEFDAVWVVRNTGIKNWEVGTLDMKYDSGNKLHKFADVFDINTLVEPTKDLTLTIDMVVPATAGKYSAVWKLMMEGTTLCTLNVSIEAVVP